MKKFVLMAALAVGIVAGLAKLTAEPSQKTTKIGFSAPVQVPGKVLAAGEYVFRLTNGDSKVEVLAADQKAVATFAGKYDYSREFTANAVARMADNGAGSVLVVKSIRYPGEKYGLSLVY